MRYLFICCLLSVLFSCNSDHSPVTQPVEDAAAAVDTPVQHKPAILLIEPGESIGLVHIGMRADTLNQLLGKPDSSDAAMGKAWMTWNGRRDEHNNSTELNIYTSYRDSTMAEKEVQLVRTTSSSFHTDEGVKVYDDLVTVGKTYKLKYVGHFQHPSGRLISIYDVPGHGIAFEIAVVGEQKLCTAIMVYQESRRLMNIYLSFLNSRGWVPSNTPKNR